MNTTPAQQAAIGLVRLICARTEVLPESKAIVDGYPDWVFIDKVSVQYLSRGERAVVAFAFELASEIGIARTLDSVDQHLARQIMDIVGDAWSPASRRVPA